MKIQTKKWIIEGETADEHEYNNLMNDNVKENDVRWNVTGVSKARGYREAVCARKYFHVCIHLMFFPFHINK